mmetsp:Transcript_8068/g.20696  ORF Transcript_8068/g.20696 Transcript_8068/m.20696 type:complete len:217 (+) Transcript_8068:143-793(+)
MLLPPCIPATLSLGHFVAPDLLQKLLCLRIVCEVVPHGLQNDVDCLCEGRLEVRRVQGPAREVLLELLVGLVLLIATVLLLPAHFEVPEPRHDYVPHVLEARVPFTLLRRAVGLLDLGIHVALGVLHEDGGARVALGHLLLTLEQPAEHVVGEDDGFQLLLLQVAVLPREHVHLTLVHPQLANVGLEEENVGALHARVEYLCRSQAQIGRAALVVL